MNLSDGRFIVFASTRHGISACSVESLEVAMDLARNEEGTSRFVTEFAPTPRIEQQLAFDRRKMVLLDLPEPD